jgi:hypothetical protein
MMTSHLGCPVEFLGGPVDGHIEVMPAPLEPYLGLKTADVRETNVLLAALARYFPSCRPTRAMVLVAIYELEQRERKRPYYCYCGSLDVTPQQFRRGYDLDAVVRRMKNTTSGSG